MSVQHCTQATLFPEGSLQFSSLSKFTAISNSLPPFWTLASWCPHTLWPHPPLWFQAAQPRFSQLIPQAVLLTTASLPLAPGPGEILGNSGNCQKYETPYSCLAQPPHLAPGPGSFSNRPKLDPPYTLHSLSSSPPLPTGLQEPCQCERSYHCLSVPGSGSPSVGTSRHAYPLQGTGGPRDPSAPSSLLAQLQALGDPSCVNEPHTSQEFCYPGKCKGHGCHLIPQAVPTSSFHTLLRGASLPQHPQQPGSWPSHLLLGGPPAHTNPSPPLLLQPGHSICPLTSCGSSCYFLLLPPLGQKSFSVSGLVCSCLSGQPFWGPGSSPSLQNPWCNGW